MRTNQPTIAIRLATVDDAQDIAVLAALDSAPIPAGLVLLGVVDGVTQAALPVRGGRPVSDPFHATAAIVALLEVRARLLRADEHSRRPMRSGVRAALALVRS